MSAAARYERSDRPVDGRFEPGADGLVQAHLAKIQRARILSGMLDVASERGAANVSVAHVVERSGVSRRTFYELFDDREDCLLAAFEDAVEHASERVLPVYRSEQRWRDRIRASLLALLRFLDEEPVIGRMLIAESLAGGAKALECRGRVLAELIAAVDIGRSESKTDWAVASLSAEGVVGGVLSVIHSRLLQAKRDPLVELLNPLMSMIVMPYLGTAAARRELDRPVPAAASRRSDPALSSDPFKDAGMRLTYRTVRVLLSIADNPSASNRAIGEGAGVIDQGQISKLLARLRRIGLISNTGLGPGLGAPNAWSLTAAGRQVAHSIRAHTNSFKPERESER